MNRARLQLALERLSAGQWTSFEELAAAFAAAQYANLQTLASASGDRGRDGVLWQPEEDPTIVLQYSVTADWRSKIRETIERISTEFDGVQVLIYFSPRVIGPSADTLVEEVRKSRKLYIQIRDQSWFLDRVNETASTEAAGEHLATIVVDPLLSTRDLIPHPAGALDNEEAAAAVLYLALQLQDDSLEKGLTKTCFEGLVRAALRGTDPQNRLSRAEVHRRIQQVVPSGSPEEIVVQVDSALARLEKNSIRHHESVDEFCLSFTERERLADKIVAFDLAESKLREVLGDQITSTCGDLGVEAPTGLSVVVDRARRVLELALLQRGETFVRAIEQGDVGIYTREELIEAVIADVARVGADESGLDGNAVPIIATSVHETLTYPTPEVLQYLQLFARSYTLFSFARATPNIQKAIVKMFSGGEIWIDTSAILPLFAETLMDADDRRFTHLIDAASGAGVRFFVTPGVVEEIERHMNRSRIYFSSSNWSSSIPFLATAYELSGEPKGGFAQWLENFRGFSRPEEDVAECLMDLFGIKVMSLSEEAEAVPEDLRLAIKEVWSEVQDRRRARSAPGVDPITAMRLASHDAENYLGVIHKRRAESSSPFGYTTWWLTLDRSAFRVRGEVRSRLGEEPPPSPVLNPDFLAHYLSIGPIRQYLREGSERAIPLMLDVGAMDVVSNELIEFAGRIRRECEGLPQRVVHRRIRDALDARRLSEGSAAGQEIGVVEDWVAEELQ